MAGDSVMLRGVYGRASVGAVKALYTAVARATDKGRNGHVRTDDGKLDLELSMPERMGGPGGDGTNPEQLFAAGYAGCFANAMRSVARRQDRESVVDGATLTAEVDIGRSGPEGRFGLAVRLTARVPGLSQEEAEELVAAAHQRCPYSNATRGNIDVDIEVVGAD
jgi:lipoyl-dependent peroxiredoxin